MDTGTKIVDKPATAMCEYYKNKITITTTEEKPTKKVP